MSSQARSRGGRGGSRSTKAAKEVIAAQVSPVICYVEDNSSDVELDEDGYEVRSEDSDSGASLDEFVVDDEDEDEVEATEPVRAPAARIDASNIISGKRTRRAPERYMDENLAQLMLADVEVEAVFDDDDDDDAEHDDDDEDNQDEDDEHDVQPDAAQAVCTACNGCQPARSKPVATQSDESDPDWCEEDAEEDDEDDEDDEDEDDEDDDYEDDAEEDEEEDEDDEEDDEDEDEQGCCGAGEAPEQCNGGHGQQGECDDAGASVGAGAAGNNGADNGVYEHITIVRRRVRNPVV